MPYKNLELELESILGGVIEAGASDLHLIPGHPPILRIDSNLTPMENREILSTDIINKIAVIIMNEQRFKELEQKRDLDFSFSYKDDSRFRVNAYYQKGNLALALRFIPKFIRSMEELGLPPIIRHFTELKQGLVLVVGPTGHGK